MKETREGRVNVNGILSVGAILMCPLEVKDAAVVEDEEDDEVVASVPS